MDFVKSRTYCNALTMFEWGAAQVVETWSQWVASGLLRHASLRQQAMQALRLLADQLHASQPSLVGQ